MDIKIDNNTIYLNGMLDSSSAQDFQIVADEMLAGDAKDIVLDLSEMQYTSSQGLRIILSLQKGIAAKNGRLTLRGVQPAVKEVFDMTGFSSILTIED